MTALGFGSDLYSAFTPLNDNSPQNNLDIQQQNNLDIHQQNKQYTENDKDLGDPIPEINDNKQIIQEQKLLSILNDIKKQKQNIKKETDNNNISYLDKLFSKKKELLKLLQFSLIILLALSVHAIIDYYLKEYISNNDFTNERLILIRLLYPISIIFILWNLKVFVK